jgi:glucan phosphoethanolaminetransferase (alkaline phosphatase superfamily)
MNMGFADKAFLASSAVVAGSTVGLPYVTGYGTELFQLVALGAWSIIARLSSGKFADQHHGVLWMVAFLLNIVCFAVIAVPLWLLTRRRLPKFGAFLIICWMVFYVAMLFVLFPATDGP